VAAGSVPAISIVERLLNWRLCRWQRQHRRQILALADQLYRLIPAARRRITGQPGNAAEQATVREQIFAACVATGLDMQRASHMSTALTAYLWEGGAMAYWVPCTAVDQGEAWVRWVAVLLLNRAAGGLETPEGRLLLPLGQEVTPQAIGILIYGMVGDDAYQEGLWDHLIAPVLVLKHWVQDRFLDAR
jgi:hypothetical protein